MWQVMMNLLLRVLQIRGGWWGRNGVHEKFRWEMERASSSYWCVSLIEAASLVKVRYYCVDVSFVVMYVLEDLSMYVREMSM